jgi:hypothetical protein
VCRDRFRLLNNELEGVGKETADVSFKVLPRDFYRETKSEEGFNQHSRCPTDMQSDYLQDKSKNFYLVSQLARLDVGKRAK